MEVGVVTEVLLFDKAIVDPRSIWVLTITIDYHDYLEHLLWQAQRRGQPIEVDLAKIEDDRDRDTWEFVRSFGQLYVLDYSVSPDGPVRDESDRYLVIRFQPKPVSGWDRDLPSKD
jgi:hypothetical protein